MEQVQAYTEEQLKTAGWVFEKDSQPDPTMPRISDPNAVRLTTQSLDDKQKATARSNINVKSVDELLADDDFIAQLKTKLGLS